MSEGESSSPRRKRRLLLLAFILLTAGVASYLIFWGGLRLWNASLPEDAPRIAMTPDDGWIARLGFTASRSFPTLVRPLMRHDVIVAPAPSSLARLAPSLTLVCTEMTEPWKQTMYTVDMLFV